MAYVLTHFFEGGTETQYRTVLEIVHPGGELPAGQTYTPRERQTAAGSW